MVWSEVVLVHLKFLLYNFIRQSFLQLCTPLKPCETCVAVHREAGARRPNCLHQWLHGIWRPTTAWSSLVWDMTVLHTLIFFFYPISVWELFAYEQWQDSWGCLHGSLPHGVRLRQRQDWLRGICMRSVALHENILYISGMCSFSIPYVQTARRK